MVILPGPVFSERSTPATQQRLWGLTQSEVFFGKLQKVRGQELSQWQRRSAHPATVRILNRRAV